MLPFISLYIYVTSVIIAGIVWGVRLEGKVNIGDRAVVDLKELLIFKLDSIDKRLDRIEKSYNGHLFKNIGGV